MAFFAIFLFMAFVVLFFYSMHIELPNNICDKQKLHIIEFLLRLTNEYLGDFVEFLFGAEIRNRMLRFFTSIIFKFKPKPPKWCKIKNILINGVGCRLYSPQGKYRKSNILLIHIHGGGWCFMRPDYYDMIWIPFIKKLGGTMISIDYQLSPEAKFKTAILECEQVLHTIYNKMYSELNIDRNKIVLIGDSAGGNLCTTLCQRALRQGNSHMIKLQVLLYPVTHMFNMLSISYRSYYENYKGTGLLNPRMMARWFLMYLCIKPTLQNIKAVLKNQHVSREIRENSEIMSLIDPSNLPDFIRKSDNLDEKKLITSYHFPPNEELSQTISKYLLDPDFCPIIGKNLENLTPAMILTAGIDILRDEGIMYVKHLRSFNVPVEWKYYPFAYHGVVNMPFSQIKKKMLNDIIDYLNKHLEL